MEPAAGNPQHRALDLRRQRRCRAGKGFQFLPIFHPDGEDDAAGHRVHDDVPFDDDNRDEPVHATITDGPDYKRHVLPRDQKAHGELRLAQSDCSMHLDDSAVLHVVHGADTGRDAEIAEQERRLQRRL